MDKSKLDSILALFNSKTDIEKEKNIENFTQNALNEQQKNQLNSIMHDPQKMNEVLGSDKAKELMKKLDLQRKE